MREVRSEYFVLKPVKKNMTLSDKAYHVLRNAIVCNELVPGDVLTEEKLCAELSISRTPIRAALRRLVEDGLAEVRGKSVTVSRLTEEDTSSINVVRRAMELLTMNELRGRVTPMLIRKLRDSIEEQKSCRMADADDYIYYIQQDYVFHTTLAEATGNRFLLDVVERLNTHSTRCLMLSTTLFSSSKPAVAEHTAIVDALEQEDYDRAYQAMEDHLRQIKARYFDETIVETQASEEPVPQDEQADE